VFAKSFAASVVASFSTAVSAVVVTIALTASLSGCKPAVPPDTVAPKITLRQPSFTGETGDQVVPSAMVLSVTDDKDPNPTITATLNGQTIPYGVAYQFLNAGNFSLRLTARDNSGNSSVADIQVSI
jgi:hypothetical protein